LSNCAGRTILIDGRTFMTPRATRAFPNSIDMAEDHGDEQHGNNVRANRHIMAHAPALLIAEARAC
jgi:hypothetical protein